MSTKKRKFLKMSGTVRILDGLHKVGTIGLMGATVFGFGEC
jgi:hypothetical protein